MAKYYWNTVQITHPGNNVRVGVLPGNPRRVSLIIACQDNALVTISNTPGTSPFGVWGGTQQFSNNVFKFNDIGPVMQDAIFVSIGGGTNRVVSCTEVVLLTQCDKGQG